MKNKVIKIALYSEVPQCGKSTIALYLFSKYNFEIISLAKAFKKMLKSLLESLGYNYDTIDRFIYGDLKETEIPEIKCSPRYLMRELGQFGVNKITKLIWCYALNSQYSERNNVILDDLRQKHEYEYLTDFIKVKINRKNEFVPEHITDNQLEGYKFDYEIDNNGTLEELYEKVDNLIEQIQLDSLYKTFIV